MTNAFPKPMQRGSVLALALALSLGALLPLAAPAATRAAPTDLFFSEYIEGSSNNKALEIYNGTGSAVDLGTGVYNVQMFFNGSASAGLTINLTGTVADGDVWVLAQSAASAPILAQADQTNGSGWFNGDDAVVLRKGTTVLDVIGQIGVDPGTEWGSGLLSTADNTIRRQETIEAGDPNGADGFNPALEWDGFANDTFGGLGSHVQTGGEQPVVAACGSALNVLEGTSATRTVTATDADGIVMSIEITGIAGSDPGTITIGETTPAPAVGGTASADVSVGATTPVGSYAVGIAATSDDADPGSCILTVVVQEVLTVGEIQGQTLDTEDGRADASDLDGDTVFVRGVVTQRIRLATSSGGTNYAFFFQDSLEAADGDPTTSDGIVVFIGRFADLLAVSGSNYFPQVGDQVVLRGVVDEFFNLTELTSPRFVVEEVDRGDLAEMVEIPEANPPADLAAAHRYWERHEGMLVGVPAGSVVTGARDVFASTFDGEVWAIRGDSAVAQRADAHARRVFRDPHPLDDVGAAGSFDNGNGQRILLVSHGLKWNAANNQTLIAPARTFDTITNELVGGVYFSFGKYGVEVTEELDLAAGVDPSLNAPPVPHDSAVEYATAPYNVENLYDFRDDPFDGCDFAGNAGCPGVTPPFNYVPADQADYEAHLDALADQIVNDLHAPDILLIQEAEDQDICAVVAGVLDCDDGVDDRDGKPDTLQELGLAIAALGGPPYDAAYDRDGADDRGIVSAFLYRSDRVEVLEATADHPVLGASPQIDYDGAALTYNADVQNPKALNAELPAGTEVGDTCDVPDVDCVFTRDPQVGYFRVWRDGIGASVFTDLYAISNHFSSGPDSRVEQRTAQAAYNAAIVEALSAADDPVRAVVGGDFNVFPEPDDPFAPPNESNQLAALYAIGLHSLWEIVLEEAPASAYSYVFEGQAQTLDNQFTTDALSDELHGVRYAHINADWPAAFEDDGSRGASDHDPQVARYDAARVDALADLVSYLLDAGAIHPSKAGKLFDRLARVERLVDVGNIPDAQDQLDAFGHQAHGLAPLWIEPQAADILELEAELIAGDL